MTPTIYTLYVTAVLYNPGLPGTSVIVRAYVDVFCVDGLIGVGVCVFCVRPLVSASHAQLQHTNGGGGGAVPQLHLQTEGHHLTRAQ